ncbi:unnamed protein product [Gulo gulo]|uniref:Uncharacterized protein n=1 Tax=Gulo gulo TaxID=48420 RepID=A0A9X9LXJ6_GULGU|nr:unnamed protein product [Gulo gulo]
MPARTPRKLAARFCPQPSGEPQPSVPRDGARGTSGVALCAPGRCVARAGLPVRGPSVCPADGASPRAPPSAPASVRPDASPGALTDDFSQLSVFSLVSRAAAMESPTKEIEEFESNSLKYLQPEQIEKIWLRLRGLRKYKKTSQRHVLWPSGPCRPLAC